MIGGIAVIVMNVKNVNYSVAQNTHLAVFAFSSISAVLVLTSLTVRVWSVNIFQICSDAWFARLGSVRIPRKLSSILNGIHSAVANGNNFARFS